jgi:hypothetical protein
MTKMVIGLAAVMLLASPASAQTLQGLIEQNIKATADRRADDAGPAAPELWIHVRTDSQRREVQAKLAWFKAIQVTGRKLDVRPIQQVAVGPARSQLRFFKAADRLQAQALLAQVRRAVPAIVLEDMSSQYRQATWIEPGHFELWLAPNVIRIATP